MSQKDVERRALEAARKACAIFPDGEPQDFERPDFIIKTVTGILGIEVTELMPPAASDSFSSPVAEQSLHEKVVRIAEQEYNRAPDAVPVTVQVFFWNPEARDYDKRVMARALVDFVRSHPLEAEESATFTRHAGLPEGFSTIGITAIAGSWVAPQSTVLHFERILPQLAARISAKNELLPTYQSNLPGASIWLLLYSCVEVCRSMPIAHGMDKWTVPFDFDRVFFYSSLDNAVVEIRRAHLPMLQSTTTR